MSSIFERADGAGVLQFFPRRSLRFSGKSSLVGG
jgi:hypothetical protein